MVVPIAANVFGYAQEVHDQLHDVGIFVDVDLSSHQLGKKVALAQTSQYNHILVVGEKEASERSVTIRVRTSHEAGDEEENAEKAEKAQQLPQENISLNAYVIRVQEKVAKHLD